MYRRCNVMISAMLLMLEVNYSGLPSDNHGNPVRGYGRYLKNKTKHLGRLESPKNFIQWEYSNVGSCHKFNNICL